MIGDRGAILQEWVARLLLVAILLPSIAGLAMALSPDGLAEWSYWRRDARGWSIFVESVGFSVLGAIVALLLGALVGLSLPHATSVSRFILAIACLPVLVPSSLMGVGWIMALGRDAVVTNQLRRLLGEHTPTIYSWPIAAAATGLRYFGIAALILSTVQTSTVPSRAAERVFALPRRQRLRLKASALVAPLISTGALLLILVFSDHILPGMFLIHTFPTEVLIQYNALMNPSGAAVLALIPTILSVAIAMAIARLLARRTWTLVQHNAPASPSNRWGYVASSIAIVIAVGLPLTGLFVRAASMTNLATAWSESRAEASHGFRLAIVGSLLTVVIALALARHALAAHHGRRPAFSWIAMINLVLPGSLLGLGMIMLVSLAPFRAIQDTELPLIFGYAARFVPVVMIVLVVAWIRIPPLAQLAATLHCRSWWVRVSFIALPPRAPTIVLSLALCVLLIAAELDISLILVRPGPTTLGVRLYTLIHTAPDHIVSALAVDMLLLVVAFMLAALSLRAFVSQAMRRSVR